MRTISPFGLDVNPKSLKVFSPPLTSRAKDYAPPEYMLKSLLCFAVQAHIFSWFTSPTKQRRYFSITNQVSQADLEEIWDGGFETSMYPYGDRM